MAPRVYDRLLHIRENINNVRQLVAGKSIADFERSPSLRAALERFLEIISEASRYVPQDLQDRFGSEISWRSIVSLGNILRHAYHLSDLPTLWRIAEQDLPALSDAVDAMLLAVDPSR